MSSCYLVKKEKEMMDDPGLMRAQGTFHLIAREASSLASLATTTRKGSGEKAGAFHRGA